MNDGLTRQLPPVWVINALQRGLLEISDKGMATIQTLIGRESVEIGGWVVLNENGFLEIYTDEQFKKKFEEVEE
jgi:hypothetical protein